MTKQRHKSDDGSPPEKRRVHHGMRYQLADDSSQLGFVDAESTPIFEALATLETSLSSGTTVTADVIAQARGTKMYELLVEAVEKMPIGFILFDGDDRLMLCNKKYEDLYPHLASLLVSGAQYEAVSQAVVQSASLSDRPVRLDGWVREGDNPAAGRSYNHRRPNSRLVETTDHHLEAGGRLSLHADITERKALEREVWDSREVIVTNRQMSKIAEDLRTSLYAVQDGLDRLAGQIGDRGKLAADVAEVGDAAGWSAKLVEHLLELSGDGSSRLNVINLNEVILGLLPTLHRMFGEAIEIENSMAGGIWRTVVNRGQAENAVRHIVLNARDAMGRGRDFHNRDGQHPSRRGRIVRDRHFFCRRLRAGVLRRYRRGNGAGRARAGARAGLHDEGSDQGGRARPYFGASIYQGMRRTYAT